MLRSRTAHLLLLAVLSAAPAPIAAEGHDAAYLRRAVLSENDPHAAENFLREPARQDALRAADPGLHERVFLRAVELKDMTGLLGGGSTARSIRLGVLDREGCVFCRDAQRFKAWAARHVPYRENAAADIDSALLEWRSLSPALKKAAAPLDERSWAPLSLEERNESLRRWAIAERDALMKADAATPSALAALQARALAAQEMLGNHDMTGVWRRLQETSQGVESLEEAARRLAGSDDPRLKDLLAQARSSADPASRLSALSRLFEGLGERPGDLLAAAPPRADQAFDADSRGVVAGLLATSLMRETEGTWAGEDLKAFYARVPLRVEIAKTNLNFDGWYEYGSGVLRFNERNIESFVKERGRSVEDLKRDPALLADLSRKMAAIFVHEAQHHRQDAWAREAGLGDFYQQGHEVEAYQVDALFILQKLKQDPAYREAAERGVIHPGELGRAHRMEELGPSFFEWAVPNPHYPEIYSKEARAWCSVRWHNRLAALYEAELRRRDGLSEAQRRRLEAAAPLKDRFDSFKSFRASLPAAGTASLRYALEKERAAAADAPRVYRLARSREEELARQTRERYDRLMAGQTPLRGEVPPPPATVERGGR